jgi:predicted ATPase
LGGLPLEADLGRQIVESTGGNPLFLEEFLAMLVEDGSLERANGSWTLTRDLAALEVPPTIEALLAARLDRLPREERTALESASVIGQVFYPSAVRDLIDAEGSSAKPAPMDSLIARDLVQRTHEEFAGEPACRFRHLLIRDAAYRRLPKGRRADLHHRFAIWLEREVGERIAEFEEIIGYHLEQAYICRTNLRPATPDRSLATLAAQHLGSAGRRAMGRGDGWAAASLFERAIALVGAEDATSIGFQLELAMAIESTGDLNGAEALLDDARLRGDAQGSAAIRARIELEDLRLRQQTRPSGVPAQVLERVPGLIAIMEQAGDDGGLASAWRLIADIELTTLNSAAATATLERALAHAEKAGDDRQASEIRKWLVLIDLWSPRPVAASLRHIDQITSSAGGNPLVQATAMTSKGWFVASLGRFDEGRTLWRQGYDLLEELHQTLWRAATAHQGGRIELFAGNPVAAEQIFRLGYDALEQMGERGYLSTVAGLMSLAVFDQGRLDEAERLADVSREACDEADIESQMLWRQGRARVLAARSELEEAEHLAREAVRIAETTDDLTSHGEALLDMAEIMRIVGRPGEAGSALHAAIELFVQKGVLVLEDRARAALAQIAV